MKHLWVVAACLVLAGGALRFANADRPVWHDEAFSLMQIRLGSTADQQLPDAGAYAALTEGPPVATLGDVLANLRRTDAQHLPSYPVLGWLAGSVATVSAPAMRYLAALLDLIAIAACFWLARAAGARRDVALWCAALYAWSPLATLLAMTVRDYSAASAALLLAVATFLHADRARTGASWLAHYAAIAVAALTHLFVAWALLAIVAFALVDPAQRKRRTIAAAISVAVAGIVGAAWYVRFLEPIYGLDFVATPVSLAQTARSMLANAGAGFLDGPVAPLAIVAVVVAAVHAIRARRWAWLPVIVLALEPWVMLVGQDVVRGGMRALVLRYWFLGAAAGCLLVPPWLAAAWPGWGRVRRAITAAVAGATLALAAVAHVHLARDPVLPDTWLLPEMVAIAGEVAASPAPVLALGRTRGTWGEGNLVTLARLLPAATPVRIAADPAELVAYRDIFATPDLVSALVRLGFTAAPPLGGLVHLHR